MISGIPSKTRKLELGEKFDPPPVCVHFIYLFVYLVKSYRSLIALILPLIFTYFVVVSLLKKFKALNGLLCADVPLRNYSLIQSASATFLSRTEQGELRILT